MNNLHIWAMRDLLRRPGETLLLAIVLALTVAFSGTALFITQSLAATAREFLAMAPALVVRKVGAGGWEPIPVAVTLASANSVPGVTRARPRCWGVASGPNLPVTIVGWDDSMDLVISRPPARGEAIAGPGVGLGRGETLRLAGAEPVDLGVIGGFAPETGIAAHDVVLLHSDDARRILGLPRGYASDLAIDVFHDEEAIAILPELSTAFPWPVKITTRAETAGAYAASCGKRGGIVFIALVPALLALILIVFHTVRERTGRRHEVGLLKALGWTTRDIVSLQIYRALIIALPAATAGMATTYALVASPGVTWPASLFFGWEDHPPGLYLRACGAVQAPLQVAALVIIPFIAAVLWPVLKSATADPIDMIEEE